MQSDKTDSTNKMNATVVTTSVTQTANEALGTKEKKLYYLIIKNAKGEQLTINVGQKTHDNVLNLLDVVTNLKFETETKQSSQTELKKERR